MGLYQSVHWMDIGAARRLSGAFYSGLTLGVGIVWRDINIFSLLTN